MTAPFGSVLLASTLFAEIDDGMWNVLGIAIYLAVGFGLLGAWMNGGPGFRTGYCVLFPLHTIVASLCRDVPGAAGGVSGMLVWAVVIFIALCLLLA